MSRIVGIVLVGLTLFVALGLILPAIYKARGEEEMRRCQNHLRQIGAVGLFHSTLPGEPLPTEAQLFFPAGTIVDPKLSADQRLSWYVLILNALDRGAIDGNTGGKKPLQFTEALKEIDIAKTWDAEVNLRLAQMRLIVAICPTQNPDSGPGQPKPTNYVGNGGVGVETAALSLDEAGARAGVFRYDSPTPLTIIGEGDGLSNTISILETREVGTWMRGGAATVRSLNPDDRKYLGPDAPFSGCHPGRGNFAFADGSVRVLTDRMSPAIFKALLTIRGTEANHDFDDR